MKSKRFYIQKQIELVNPISNFPLLIKALKTEHKNLKQKLQSKKVKKKIHYGQDNNGRYII